MGDCFSSSWHHFEAVSMITFGRQPWFAGKSSAYLVLWFSHEQTLNVSWHQRVTLLQIILQHYIPSGKTHVKYCQCPFQEPKLEVPTVHIRPIFQAYVTEYPHKIWSYMVQYLHFRILKFPSILDLFILESPSWGHGIWWGDWIRKY